MVLSDMPFERSHLLHSRYTMLRRPGSAPVYMEEESTNQTSKDYASFLKDQERKVGPEGFLDSTKLSHTFHVKKEKDKYKGQKPRRPTLVNTSINVEQEKKEHDRRIKVIELSRANAVAPKPPPSMDHMWQHKQEERELKRTEGDIIKNQRSVKHMLRDYENVITKRRMAEEKKLNTGLEKYTVLRREHVHHSHDLTKSRTHDNILSDHAHKDRGRKTEIMKSDLARTYKAKMSEMELKQVELMRLNQEFETKMRQKEQEQHRLKQELAELAITLNMEVQKGRTESFEANRDKKKETTARIVQDLNAKQTIDHKLASSDGDNKQAEMTKRKLSADLKLTKDHIAIKQRDGQRHLTDTQMRLEDNSTVQRQLNEAAFHAEMDLRSKQMQQNIEAHNTRRITQRHQFMRHKKISEDAKQEVWEARFKKRANEKTRLEHEDGLKFFQKMVNKGEEQEQNLYSKVRNAEYTRQKQEQNVRRLQQQLAEARRRNAQTLKQEMTARTKQEIELEQALIKERAELDKVHSQREEGYVKLQQHRQFLKTDKHNLSEHEREHDRLTRIGSKSDTFVEAY